MKKYLVQLWNMHLAFNSRGKHKYLYLGSKCDNGIMIFDSEEEAHNSRRDYNALHKIDLNFGIVVETKTEF